MPPTEVTGENSLLLYQQKIQTNLFFHGGDYHARSYATGTGQDRTLPEEVERLLRVESEVLRSMGAQHALSTTLRFHRRRCSFPWSPGDTNPYHFQFAMDHKHCTHTQRGKMTNAALRDGNLVPAYMARQ
jgi:hypothetical protein